MPTKPQKPRADFPLWWRVDPRCSAGGYWCRTIRGRQIAFGPDADDAELRLAQYVVDLTRGEDERPAYAEVTLADLYGEFVEFTHARAQAGKIKPRSFEESRRFLDHFCAFAGADTAAASITWRTFTRYYRDSLAAGFGTDQIQKRIYTVRRMFEHAAGVDLLEHQPKFGPDFEPMKSRETEKVKTRSTRSGTRRDRTPYTPAQVRKLIRHAPQPLKAMILLGINCAFGGTDCAALTMNHLHLRIERDAAGKLTRATGRHDFPRPKNTAVERRCPLWRRTVLALEQWLAIRAKKIEPAKRRKRQLVADANAQLVFLTRFGKSFVRDDVTTVDGRISGVVSQDAVNQEFSRLCEKLGVPGGFYRLRHTSITWMNASNDSHAECRIRGHKLPGMSRVYVHGIEAARLRAVAAVVRRKLYPRKPAGAVPAASIG